MPKKKVKIPNKLREVLKHWKINKSEVIKYTDINYKTLDLLIKEKTSPDLATAFKITSAINYILLQRGISLFYLPTDIWEFHYLPHGHTLQGNISNVKSDITEKLTKGESC